MGGIPCKIIINDNMIRGLSAGMGDLARAGYYPGPNEAEVIRLMNQAEDCLAHAATLYLRGSEYTGPLAKTLAGYAKP